MKARLKLPPKGSLSPNNAVDPLKFYYHPLVGWLFAARLELGLSLLRSGPRFRRLLELGYGSGLLMPTLAGLTDEYHGVDLEAAPPGLRETMKGLGVEPASLSRADIRSLPYDSAFFDGAVAFSILEHLKPDELRAAIDEAARVLTPGGRLLVGCPAVHAGMNAAFAAIGFSGIEDHHFSSLANVRDAATGPGRPFVLEARASLPRVMDRAPLGWAPYGVLLLRKL